MRMTYAIAYSLGWDAANRQMQAAGRTVWDEDDMELAAGTLTQHFPPCQQFPGIQPYLCGCPSCYQPLS